MRQSKSRVISHRNAISVESSIILEKGPSWFSLDTISWEVLSDGGGFRFRMGSLNLLKVYISIIPKSDKRKAAHNSVN